MLVFEDGCISGLPQQPNGERENDSPRGLNLKTNKFKEKK